MQEQNLTTLAPLPQEQPTDEPDDVLFNTLYGIRTIELNRPRKLNSLNGSMARKIVLRLKEWEKSQLANVIVIKGRGEKAFCAGGDVAALAQLVRDEGEGGKQKGKEYFALEYQLDHLIATYPKPYVAFMDGYTMGGGAGLSVHAPFRIATERTRFAMPETKIGFFPDVGASFFLPRLDGRLGTYLALTSEELTGVNAFYAGVATHYLHSSSLPDLENRLAELTFRDYETMPERCRIVSNTIEEYNTGLPHDQPMKPSGTIRAAIDRCFNSPSLNSVIAALGRELSSSDSEVSSWADKTLQTLEERSPTSIRVALRQMHLGSRWTIREAFEREHFMATKFLSHPDFTEGVTAVLITKQGKATWQPPPKSTDDFIDVEEGTQRLQLFSPVDYASYPYAWIGLPSEREIEKVVRVGYELPTVRKALGIKDGDDRPEGLSRARVVRYFDETKRGKQGVVEKVREVLERKTREVPTDDDVDEENLGGVRKRCIWIG
ncbi:MAG: hypothetical protein M1816_004861 [Peltula sp. TS41687]|nr:MAG: hypothetical protein M1816_004861 [Peltula sp. TS41687]